jgi:hypothetical protein
MRILSLALVIAGVGVGGCGAASVSPAKPPALTGAESTRVQKGRQPPPRLIAPPPAYGNKIVMAGRHSQIATN